MLHSCFFLCPQFCSLHTLPACVSVVAATCGPTAVPAVLRSCGCLQTAVPPQPHHYASCSRLWEEERLGNELNSRLLVRTRSCKNRFQMLPAPTTHRKLERERERQRKKERESERFGAGCFIGYAVFVYGYPSLGGT